MLNVNGLAIALDRHEQGADVNFVSHAHTDHIAAARRSRPVLASSETLALIDAAYGIKASGNHNGSMLEAMLMLDSGHMLGSKQLAVTDEKHGTKTLYSGDFQMRRSAAAAPIEVTDADVLIIDSTYPYPDVSFDDHEEVEAELQEWTLSALADKVVLFSAYAMGKAQELICILNRAGIRPMVGSKISRINKVYEANGIRLDCEPLYSDGGKLAAGGGNFVGVVDSSEIKDLAYLLAKYRGANVATAVASGWAKIFKFRADAQFPLSDHADFSQSIDYIEATGAKKIVTYGGSQRLFAANLRAKGYDAVPFSDAPANLFDGGFRHA